MVFLNRNQYYTNDSFSILISYLQFSFTRDSAPNKFMVLMKFRDAQSASEFYQQYNCKAFSSMEVEF